MSLGLHGRPRHDGSSPSLNLVSVYDTNDYGDCSVISFGTGQRLAISGWNSGSLQSLRKEGQFFSRLGLFVSPGGFVLSRYKLTTYGEVRGLNGAQRTTGSRIVTAN